MRGRYDTGETALIICIADVIGAGDAARIRDELAQVAFRDGRETAGWHARTVKRNEQAPGRDQRVQRLRTEIDGAIARSPLFQIAARPRHVMPARFSRYGDAMEYGSHVDDAVMAGPEGPMRSDVSFTLFLSEPDSYDGGELVIDTTAGEQSYKLDAGSMIVYPASTLHRVAPVTRGERLAAIGWVQSQVRDPEKREILFDLDTTRRQIFDRDGKTDDFDALTKSVSNLLRMWAEV